MLQTLRSLFVRKASLARKSARKTTARSHLNLEALERREVPTVTPHGGSVLPSVEVQALYYGSNWYNNSSLFAQTGQFEDFLNKTVGGSYMDMLNNAGYGVGRGSFSGGKISMANPGSVISDGDIQNAIQNAIRSSNPLAAPDGNRLYMVYVEPNVEVTTGSANSVSNFAGYHSAFNGSDAQGHAATIHYAVITTPGGTVGNAKNNYALNTFDEMTEASTHELAEAVTDAVPGYGWFDTNTEGEVGDLANGQTVYLNGYAVQREADKNDQPMTPAGAQAVNAVQFVLQTNGNLYLHGASGLSFLSGGIASVSAQGIDNNGHAMVDVVTTSGYAYEYHEGSGWTYLTSGVTSAKADQGVSYVLLTNGAAWEYKDTGSWTQIDSNVTAIDAGTDRYGVNMMTEVWYGSGYEHSDSTGWHYIGSGITAISAGQQGILTYLSSGNAYWWSEASASSSLLGSGVAQVTTGTDASGNYMVDMLYSNGNLYEYQTSSGWNFLDSSVQSIGKARAGAVDMVFSWGDAWEHSSAGWTYLTCSAKGVA